MGEPWRWQFLGFQSAEGRPVQSWFNGLPDNDRYEILDLLNTLANVTDKLWRRPEFDPLEGAGGISEIRVPGIRSESGSMTYRIYGYFGPEKRQYCFLHGTNKKEKNDEEGKSIAKNRFDQLKRRKATVHKFAFEKGIVVEINKRT
jgi:Phage derived protein Gp49-like (DUF891)